MQFVPDLDNGRMATDHTQASVYLSRSVHCVPLTLPDRDYFSAAAEMVPCRSIGGNFFDYLDLDGSFGVAVGDVAGKDAAAGLLGGRVQEIFSYVAGAVPSMTIAAINASMVKKGVEARFVAVFYGILSPNGEVTYCNAGHNPPLLISKNGVRRLTVSSLARSTRPRTTRSSSP